MGGSIDELEAVILDIFQHTRAKDSNEHLGLVIQQYFHPSISGHLSNEVRVSPTRNQWKYETEIPTWSPTKGLNSKLAPLPDPATPLPSGAAQPHQSLRSLGKWVSENVSPRCHIEWLCNGNSLWILQLDLEWSQLDKGVDPTLNQTKDESAAPILDPPKYLKKYNIGTETKWKKLKNLSDFDFEGRDKAPIIYILNSKDIIASKTCESTRSDLVSEIARLTSDRVVVRTDCCQENARSFNLPRTDTVSAETAVKWCVTTLETLDDEGLDSNNVVFLVHAFLPAMASAWAYASLGSPTVFIDALWGLPDGLQVLPVDSYEVNVLQGKIISTKSTFKPRFLREEPDGSWKYENVLRKKGRSTVLSRPDILEIAKRTHKIAEKLSDDAQIMWFSGIPESFNVGKNLPWFRSREQFQEAPRLDTRYAPYDVKRPSDLDGLPERNAMIRLAPDADLIRDDHFLQKVIDKAKEYRLPVMLEGSSLGHIYYRLCEEGVGIYLANAPKYYRKRDKREFGKIVRDKIPENIVSGGETVAEAILEKRDILHGLSGKIMEEIEEFLLADDRENQVAEMADILEVLRGMAFNSGIDWKEVVSVATKKRNKRGGFSERKVLLETSLPNPKGSKESKQLISIQDLGQHYDTDTEVNVPITAILNTIGRNSLLINGTEFGSSFRIQIRDGNLIITKTDRSDSTTDESQLKLFDEL